eukprot:1976887-Rhodomonas_salina.3
MESWNCVLAKQVSVLTSRTVLPVINIFVGVFVDCYTAASSDGVIQKKEKLDPKKLPDVWDDPQSPRRLVIYRVLDEQVAVHPCELVVLVQCICEGIYGAEARVRVAASGPDTGRALLPGV